MMHHVLDAPEIIPTGQSSMDLAFLLDVVVVDYEAGLREWDSLCCSFGTGLSDIEDDLSDVSPFI